MPGVVCLFFAFTLLRLPRRVDAINKTVPPTRVVLAIVGKASGSLDCLKSGPGLYWSPV